MYVCTDSGAVNSQTLARGSQDGALQRKSNERIWSINGIRESRTAPENWERTPATIDLGSLSCIHFLVL